MLDGNKNMNKRGAWVGSGKRITHLSRVIHKGKTEKMIFGSHSEERKEGRACAKALSILMNTQK